MEITITATRTYGDGGTEIVFERGYTAPAGARKGLSAAINRICREWRKADGVSEQVAEREAARWDGTSDFAQTVAAWDKVGTIRFEARNSTRN